MKTEFSQHFLCFTLTSNGNCLWMQLVSWIPADAGIGVNCSHLESGATFGFSPGGISCSDFSHTQTLNSRKTVFRGGNCSAQGSQHLKLSRISLFVVTGIVIKPIVFPAGGQRASD